MGITCKHGHNDGALHKPCWRCRAENKENAANDYEFVLRLLVNLKDYKDEHGKDEYYRENQPKAWDLARRTLHSKEQF
jgi:hypothetical protein